MFCGVFVERCAVGNAGIVYENINSSVFFFDFSNLICHGGRIGQLWPCAGNFPVRVFLFQGRNRFYNGLLSGAKKYNFRAVL